MAKPDPALLVDVVADKVLDAWRIAAEALRRAGIRQLVYMKLKASRLRDRTDVFELIKRGLDVEACRTYLTAHAPALVTTFEDSVAHALAEE